jgi:hypothetical protein
MKNKRAFVRILPWRMDVYNDKLIYRKYSYAQPCKVRVTRFNIAPSASHPMIYLFQVNFEVGAELNDRYLKSTAMSCLDNKRVQVPPLSLPLWRKDGAPIKEGGGCREGAINIAACVDDDDTGWWQATLAYQRANMHVVLDGEIFATCQQNI